MNTEPTKTFIDEYGYRTEEWRNNDGHLHREDGPATIRYNQDGNIKYEAYWQNGLCHRDGAPAEISYNPDGTTRHQEYWQGGKLQPRPVTVNDIKTAFNTKLEAIKQRNQAKTQHVKHDRKPGRTLS